MSFFEIEIADLISCELGTNDGLDLVSYMGVTAGYVNNLLLNVSSGRHLP